MPVQRALRDQSYTATPGGDARQGKDYKRTPAKPANPPALASKDDSDTKRDPRLALRLVTAF
jgi:hypothetical protein